MSNSSLPAEPAIRIITARDIADAVGAGLSDFQSMPRFGFAVGLFFTLGGLLIIATIWQLGMAYLAYPLAAGFMLIGPFAALLLYEVSRRRELGQPLTFADAWATIRERTEVRWMAFVTLFIFIMWMYQVRLLIALFLGVSANFATLQSFIAAVLGTTEGLVFLAVGNLVGAVLSLIIFTLTVVSFPMLLDRNIDFVTAMITSVRAVVANPFVMVGWAFIVTVTLLASIATFFLGLVVTLPVLGHATWHLYRKLIVPVGQAA